MLSPSAHLDSGAGVQHDVLDGALNVFCPWYQPCHLVVMTNFFPFMTLWRLGALWVSNMNTSKMFSIVYNTAVLSVHLTFGSENLSSLAAVDDDVFRPNATFKHSHFWMISSPTKQAGGLNSEVSNTFFVVVHEAETILLQGALILFFYFLEKYNKEKKRNNFRGLI